MNIYFLVLNDFVSDSRVLKELKSVERLTSQGVNLFALHKNGLPETEACGQFSSVFRFQLMFNWKYLPVSLRHLLSYLEWTLKILLKIDFLKKKIIHINDLKPLPIGLLIKFFSFGSCVVIYDCHEYETEVQYFNHRPFIKKLYKLLESICLKFVDEVICVTDSIAEAYVVDYGIKKPHLIMNCPPFRASFDKGTLFRKKFGIRDDQSIYLYQGSITRGRGVSETIAAFKLLEDSFVLIFMGYGELVGEVIVAQKNCSRIFYHEAVPPGVLLDYTASADYGICFAPNICKSYYYSLSNKIFEYIQARLPLIVSPLFEFKRLVESENIGTVARGDDVESLIETIRKTADLDRELFRSNCNKVASLYCWENQSKILESIYKKYLH